MDKSAKIYVAGHRGLVGGALLRVLTTQGFTNLVTRTHAELDLTRQDAVAEFFTQEKPEYVFLAAAKVGGIHANATYPADFIRINLEIQANVIHQSYVHGVKRLLFLGSTCIYPRDCPQPIKEEYLLTGPLEPTNSAYALAKIAGIEMCRSYNQQYGTQFLCAMPTNLYGPGDNYDLENSHVLPALVRKFHEAKVRGDGEVVIWGTGKPRREFLYSDDMADASVFLMKLPKSKYKEMFCSVRYPLINVGYGSDIAIADLATKVATAADYRGEIIFDVNRPDGVQRKLADSSRLNAIGWHPKTSLEKGLQLVYENFRDMAAAVFYGCL